MKHLLLAIAWALLAGALFVWGDSLAGRGLLDHPETWCILAFCLPGAMCFRSLIKWQRRKE